jgi:hypothetical protein
MTGPGVQVVEELALRVDDGVDGDVDDGVDEVIAVFEVVVELAAAGAGTSSRLMPAVPFSAMSSAAACRIRSRVARPFAVAGACVFTMTEWYPPKG